MCGAACACGPCPAVGRRHVGCTGKARHIGSAFARCGPGRGAHCAERAIALRLAGVAHLAEGARHQESGGRQPQPDGESTAHYL